MEMCNSDVRYQFASYMGAIYGGDSLTITLLNGWGRRQWFVCHFCGSLFAHYYVVNYYLPCWFSDRERGEHTLLSNGWRRIGKGDTHMRAYTLLLFVRVCASVCCNHYYYDDCVLVAGFQSVVQCE